MADRTIRVAIEAVVSRFQAGMAQASTSAKAFGSQLLGASSVAQKHSESFTLMGAAVAGAGAAIIGGLGSAAKAAIDFEQSFSGVRKTVDASGPELDALAGQFRDLATEIPVSVEELSKIGELGGALGIPKENLLDFTETIALLGETTDLTVEDAAMTFGQLANVLSLTGEDLERLGSTIVDLGNKGASTEPQITALMLHMGGAAANIGLTADEVAGLSAALANVGIPAEAGGSAISQIFAKLSREVALGGPLLENFATVAQMSAEDFATAFKDRPGAAVTAFLDGLRQIAASGGNLTVVLDALGITEIRQVRAMQSLANASTSVSDTLKTSEDAFRTNTALSDEAAKKFETFASKLSIASNKVNDAKIEVGGFITLAAEPFVAAVGNMAAKLGDIDGPLGAVVVAVGGLVGAVTLLGGAFLIALPRIQATKVAIAQLKAESTLAAGSIGLLGKASKLALAGIIVTAAFAARDALEGLVDTIFEAAGGASKLETALEMDKQGASAGAIKYLTGIDIAAAKAAKGVDNAGKKAAGAVPKVDALGDEALDLAAAASAAADAAQGMALSFDSLADNQLGVTASSSVRDLEESIADAHAKLKDLKDEQPPGFDREKWFPSEGDTTLDDMQKDRDQFYRDQAEKEAEFYADQRTEAAKAAEDRAREIGKTERDIADMQDQLREAKRSALQVLMESTTENTAILNQFVDDLNTLVESGKGVLARKFAEWGPASAAALREAVAMGLGSDGFGTFEDKTRAAIEAEKRLADTEWDKWPTNFEEKGRSAGEAAGKGVEDGLAKSLAEAFSKPYTVDLGVDILVNPNFVEGDKLGSTRPYGSDPSPRESTTDDLLDILNGNKRAAGGPVRAGYPYWVGEDGPEPFVPAVDGRILSKQEAAAAVATVPRTIAPSLSSSSSTGSGGDVHIHGVTINGARTDSPEQFGRRFIRAVSRGLDEQRRAGVR